MKKIIAIIRLSIILAVFIFLAYFLNKNFHSLKSYNIKISYPYLLLAFCVTLLSHFFQGLIWREIMLMLNQKIGLIKSLKIYFLSQLGRYIPGRVWLVTGRIYLCNKEGVAEIKATSSIVLEFVFLILSGIILLIGLAQEIFIRHYIKLLIALSVCLILSTPKVINILLNSGARIFKKKLFNIEISHLNILRIILLYMALWLLFGAALYLVILSIYNINILLLPKIISVFSIACLLSVLGFMTPAGIGIREGFMVLLLKPYMPLVTAMAVSIISRIMLTLSELIILAIVLLFRYSKHIGSRSNPMVVCES